MLIIILLKIFRSKSDEFLNLISKTYIFLFSKLCFSQKFTLDRYNVGLTTMMKFFPSKSDNFS